MFASCLGMSMSVSPTMRSPFSASRRMRCRRHRDHLAMRRLVSGQLLDTALVAPMMSESAVSSRLPTV